MIECKLNIDKVSEDVSCAQGYCKIRANSVTQIREEIKSILLSAFGEYPDTVIEAIDEFIGVIKDESNKTDKHNT